MTAHEDEAATVAVSYQNGVAYLELRNPRHRNALTHHMFRRMEQLLREAASAESVNVVVIHSNGPVFCSGLDLTELATAHRKRAGAVEDLNRILDTSANVCGMIAESRKPVIVAVQGACVGIGTLMFLACDLGFMATGARLLLPGGAMGAGYFAPALSKLLGSRRAKSLLLTARDFEITADNAYQWGLAAALHSQEQLDDEVRRYAADLASMPAGWLQLQKAGADHYTSTLSMRDAIRAGAQLDAIAHSSGFVLKSDARLPLAPADE